MCLETSRRRGSTGNMYNTVGVLIRKNTPSRGKVPELLWSCFCCWSFSWGLRPGFLLPGPMLESAVLRMRFCRQKPPCICIADILTNCRRARRTTRRSLETARSMCKLVGTTLSSAMLVALHGLDSTWHSDNLQSKFCFLKALTHACHNMYIYIYMYNMSLPTGHEA